MSDPKLDEAVRIVRGIRPWWVSQNEAIETLISASSRAQAAEAKLAEAQQQYSSMSAEAEAAIKEWKAEVAQLRADLAEEVADNVSLRERHVTQGTADRMRELEAEVERLRRDLTSRDTDFGLLTVEVERLKRELIDARACDKALAEMGVVDVRGCGVCISAGWSDGEKP